MVDPLAPLQQISVDWGQIKKSQNQTSALHLNSLHDLLYMKAGRQRKKLKRGCCGVACQGTQPERGLRGHGDPGQSPAWVYSQPVLLTVTPHTKTMLFTERGMELILPTCILHFFLISWPTMNDKYQMYPLCLYFISSLMITKIKFNHYFLAQGHKLQMI